MSPSERRSADASSTRLSSNRRCVLDEPANDVSIARGYHSRSPGGPAIVSGRVRLVLNWASSMKNGTPPKWSAWKWVTRMVSMALRSMPSRFKPMSDEAPQSMRNDVRAARTWKQVLRRPPLPKASPQPTKVTCMDAQFPRPAEIRGTPSQRRRTASVAKPGGLGEPRKTDNPQVARNGQANLRPQSRSQQVQEIGARPRAGAGGAADRREIG